MNLTVTELAQAKLSDLIKDHDASDQAIRVFAQGGGCGCSGPQFGMGLDNPQETDSIVEFGSLKFIADTATMGNTSNPPKVDIKGERSNVI